MLPWQRPARSVHRDSAWSCCGCCLFVDSDDDEGVAEATSRLSTSETSALALARDSELAGHVSTGFATSKAVARGQLDLGEPRAPKNFPMSQLSNML